ncbi:MAG: hypothetical protein QM765_30215 [Myxococcales bacterium]
MKKILSEIGLRGVLAMMGGMVMVGVSACYGPVRATLAGCSSHSDCAREYGADWYCDKTTGRTDGRGDCEGRRNVDAGTVSPDAGK